VTVLDGDTTSTTRVTTGVVGTSRIEVTDGLDAGDRVVIADITADLPTTDSDSGTTGGFENGFGGGGPQVPAGGPVIMRQ
jgi:HlyD family secretion protein